MIKEHDRVVLRAAVPEEGLEPGDVGTVVHVYRDGRAYEVEFVTLEGRTAAVVKTHRFAPCRAARLRTRARSAPRDPEDLRGEAAAGPSGLTMPVYKAVFALIVAGTMAEIALAGEAAFAPGPPSVIAEELIAVDFEEIELPTLIRFVSDVTKRNFVFDDRVRGKVSIVASEKMSVEQVYAAFQSALLLAGFTTVTSGTITKIVPVEEAKTSAIETIGPGNVAVRSDEVVTELLTLKSIPVADALPIVERLVSTKGVVAAYATHDALVIVDTASNIGRIRRVLNALEGQTATRQLTVLRLKNASAAEITATLQPLLGE